MKKWDEKNPGGVNGLGLEKLEVGTEEFLLLRQRIEAEAKQLSHRQILENKVLKVKLLMLNYLNDNGSEGTKEAGTFLKDLLEELRIKKSRFAKYIELHPTNFSSILTGRRKISVQMAIQLGEIFNIDSEIWMKIQTKNDLIQTRQMLKQEKGKYNLRDLIDLNENQPPA